MIESAQNATFKKLLSLTTSKGLKDEGLFLLSGEKLVREFLKRPHLDIDSEIVPPDGKPIAHDARQTHLSKPLFEQIDVLGTHFNILVLKQPEIAVLKEADIADYKPQGMELALPVGDPGNLGALIRSAQAFGATRVILTREAAHPFLPKCVKASAGSVMRVSLTRGPSLKAFPESCIALDMNGTPIDDFAWQKRGILAVGEEGPGLGTARFKTRVSIPTKGVESLNVVVAASIALSRWARL